MMHGYHFQRELLAHHTYISDRLRKRPAGRGKGPKSMTTVLYRVNLAYLSGDTDRPIKDMIDDIVDDG